MYIGSWQTRVQVPKAAALTRPSLSAVVMSTRQELGAKMLSHHSGRTSILFVMDHTDFLESAKVDRGTAGLPLPAGERVGVRGFGQTRVCNPSPHPSPNRTRVYPSSVHSINGRSRKHPTSAGRGSRPHLRLGRAMIRITEIRTSRC